MIKTKSKAVKTTKTKTRAKAKTADTTKVSTAKDTKAVCKKEVDYKEINRIDWPVMQNKIMDIIGLGYKAGETELGIKYKEMISKTSPFDMVYGECTGGAFNHSILSKFFDNLKDAGILKEYEYIIETDIIQLEFEDGFIKYMESEEGSKKLPFNLKLLKLSNKAYSEYSIGRWLAGMDVPAAEMITVSMGEVLSKTDLPMEKYNEDIDNRGWQIEIAGEVLKALKDLKDRKIIIDYGIEFEEVYHAVREIEDFEKFKNGKVLIKMAESKAQIMDIGKFKNTGSRKKYSKYWEVSTSDENEIVEEQEDETDTE